MLSQKPKKGLPNGSPLKKYRIVSLFNRFGDGLINIGNEVIDVFDTYC